MSQGPCWTLSPGHSNSTTMSDLTFGRLPIPWPARGARHADNASARSWCKSSTAWTCPPW